MGGRAVVSVEPVLTHSASKKNKTSSPVADKPTSALPLTQAEGLSLASIQSAFEQKLDERMSRMESTFRSSIASTMSGPSVY